MKIFDFFKRKPKAEQLPSINIQTRKDIYQLQKGQVYRVIKPFTDFDGILHPAGKEWTFDEISYLPYDAGLSLFVIENGQRTHYRFWDSVEGQEQLLQTFMNYVELIIDQN